MCVLVVAYGDARTHWPSAWPCWTAPTPWSWWTTRRNPTPRRWRPRRAPVTSTPARTSASPAAVNRGLAQWRCPAPTCCCSTPTPPSSPTPSSCCATPSPATRRWPAPPRPSTAPAPTDPPPPVCWPFPTPARAWVEAIGLGRFARGWEYVIASVLLVRGAALVDVGGLDEGFFLYAEEADWERRATRRGWSVRYRPDARATHVGAATDPDPARRHVRFHAGVERYVRKWHGPRGWRCYQGATVLTALRRAALQRGPARRASLRLAALYARGPGRRGGRQRSGAAPRATTSPPSGPDRSAPGERGGPQRPGGARRAVRGQLRLRGPRAAPPRSSTSSSSAWTGRASSPLWRACRRGAGPSWSGPGARPPTACPARACAPPPTWRRLVGGLRRIARRARRRGDPRQ